MWTRSWLGLNPLWTRSWLGLSPLWTRSWLGLNPLWTRSWLGLSPLWTRSWLGLSPLWTRSWLGLNPLWTLSWLGLKPLWTRSWLGLNPLWTRSWLGLNPLWTRSWLGLNPLWTRSWLGLSPLWTRSWLGLEWAGLDYNTAWNTGIKKAETDTELWDSNTSASLATVTIAPRLPRMRAPDIREAESSGIQRAVAGTASIQDWVNQNQTWQPKDLCTNTIRTEQKIQSEINSLGSTCETTLKNVKVLK